MKRERDIIDKSIKVPMMQPTSQKSTFNYTQNKD